MNFCDKFLDVASCKKGPEIGTGNFHINKQTKGTWLKSEIFKCNDLWETVIEKKILNKMDK
jgi:hypothetical protein